MNINPDSRPVIKHSKRVWMWAALSLLALTVFAWVYWSEPIAKFPIPSADYWNDKVTDGITLIAAVAAAALGIKLTRHFKPSEPPYRIWFIFTLGWWAWVGGELLGIVYDYFYWYKDLPEITFIDLFWLLGYIFFGLSIYYQFHLIYRYKRGRNSALFGLFIIFALLVALGLTQWALAAGLGEGASWGALYLAVIYPVFDLLEGAAALWLFFLFGRGYLGRPWWGLIAFACADAINIFFWMGGYRWISDQAYYRWDLISNIFYVGGYLITALAFLAAHEHIERGITVRTEPLNPTNNP